MGPDSRGMKGGASGSAPCFMNANVDDAQPYQWSTPSSSMASPSMAPEPFYGEALQPGLLLPEAVSKYQQMQANNYGAAGQDPAEAPEQEQLYEAQSSEEMQGTDVQ